MRYSKYPSYRDSGVEWLGEVPDYWESYRIDWISTIIRGNTGFKKDELLDNGEYVALQYGKTYKVDEVNEAFNFYVNDEFYKSSQVVHYGDTILISTSETVEDLGHSCFYSRNDLGLIGGEQILLKPNAKVISKRYLYYSSKVFCNTLKRYATGLKVFRFNIDDLKSIFTSLPPLQEQQTIANYLDIATAKIDTLIEKQTKLIELLKEKRQAVISTAVTRGLDNTVAMKDSGVEWLGEIPESWEVKKTKNIFSLIIDPAHDNNTYELLSIYTDIGVKPRKELEQKGNKATTTDGYWKVQKKDIIVNKLLAWMGAIGVSDYDGVTSPAYDILRPKKDISSDFYHLLFRTKKAQTEFKKYSRGIMEMRLRLYFSEFGQIKMPVPSYEEQVRIINSVKDRTSKIDRLTIKATKAIDLLKEKRTALISSAVAGKIDVQEIA